MKTIFYKIFLIINIIIFNAQTLAAESPATSGDLWQPPPFAAQTAAGETLRFPEDLAGPTVVFFWASWCPFCKALMPHLQSIIDEYGGAVRILAPNFREDEDPAAILEEYGYEFVLIPEADAIAESWGVKGTPGLYLTDRSGRVVFNLRTIPQRAYPPERFANNEGLKRYQKAARVAPFWAAQLRTALDSLLAAGE
jgi:thiol-disulfide isomerase/thioredoxin